LLERNGCIGIDCKVGRFEFDAFNEVIKSSKENWDAFIVAGGDGTLNEVVSGMATSDCKIPLGVFPSGTTNDFANYIKASTMPEQIIHLIEKEQHSPVDVGIVNDQYFINVVAGGLFTSVAHNTDKNSKLLLGNIAYFIEGVREFLSRGIKSTKLLIETPEEQYIEDVTLFLIANSSSIGGIEKMAPFAKIKDGLLDCIIIKTTNILEITELVYEMFRGKHVNNKNVLYLKTNSISVSSLEHDTNMEIDIDGEYGGYLPINVTVRKHQINIFM